MRYPEPAAVSAPPPPFQTVLPIGLPGPPRTRFLPTFNPLHPIILPVFPSILLEGANASIE